MSLLFSSIPANPLIDRFVDLSYELSERIIQLLKEKNLSQREFAAKLQKKDSEVSRWLRGDHNFTLKTVAAIEMALEEKLLTVKNVEANYTIDNWASISPVEEMGEATYKMSRPHQWIKHSPTEFDNNYYSFNNQSSGITTS